MDPPSVVGTSVLNGLAHPVSDTGFSGTFVSEDTVVAGSLQIRPDRVTLWAAGTELASWSPDQCRVERLTVARFAIHGDGEMLTFTADDPTAVDQAISDHLHSTEAASSETAIDAPANPAPPTENVAVGPSPAIVAPAVENPPAEEEPTLSPGVPVTRRPRIKTFRAKTATPSEALALPAESDGGRAEADETTTAPEELDAGNASVADEAIAAARRRMKSIRAARWLKSDVQALAIKGGALMAVLGVLAAVGFALFVLTGGLRGEPVIEPVVTTTIPPPPPTTTTVPLTAPEPPTTLFHTDPAELTDRWNQLAELTRPELVLLNDLGPAFLISLTPYITMEGLIDPASGSVTLTSVPTLTPEGDGSILTSLGLLIAMADPSLDGSDRRMLLEALGLDVRDPELNGLDGTATYNGLTYHLVFQADQGTLVLTVKPQGTATTGEATPTTAAP
jgi:hypothetical protein